MYKSIKHIHTVVFVVAVWIALTATVFAQAQREREDDMTPIYNFSVMPRLEPSVYTTTKFKINSLFEVPGKNAIGTNDIGNALTKITFGKRKLFYTGIKRGFIAYVDKGDGFLRVYDDDTIAFAVGRGFVTLSMKKKTHTYHSVAGNFNFKFSDYYAIDPEKQIYVFDIYSVKRDMEPFLRVMDLSTGDVLGEKDSGSFGLRVLDGTLFLFDDHAICPMNASFEKVDHPLAAVFETNRHLLKGHFYDLEIHPYLPFAIVYERQRDKSYNTLFANTWVISWDEKDAGKPMIKVLEGEISRFEFTYDGKWLYMKRTDTSPSQNIIMPVNPEFPGYLGAPIYLGVEGSSANCGGACLMRHPSGLVVSECDGYKEGCHLVKWDFSEAEKWIESR